MEHTNAKAAGENGGHREFIAVSGSWRPFEKNTLKGFVSILLPSGMRINDVTLHERDGKRWIGMPAQRYTALDGSTKFSPIVEFESDKARFRFQSLALKALDRLLEGSK